MIFSYFIFLVCLLSIFSLIQSWNIKNPLKFNHRIVSDLKKVSINIAALISVPLLFNVHQSLAASTQQYSNPYYHTTLNYPADFVPLSGQLSGDRKIEAFVDPNDPDTSLSIVFTPIPADFSRLSSFGGKDSIRDYVLPKGEGVKTEIVNEYIKGETYTLEYIISAPNVPTRHVQSVFALRPQEAIIALTIQTKQDTYLVKKEKLDLIAPSLHYDDM